MEAKKNSKKDLNKKSGMYFVIGLLLALALVFTALEWKTYKYDINYDYTMNMVEREINVEYVEKFQMERPKIEQVLSHKIKIEDNDAETEETQIMAIEVDTNTKILEAFNIEVVEKMEEVEVNWVTIEEVPIFPGCENVKDKRACFNKMMQQHIQKSFRYPAMAQEMSLQGRVSTQFIIQKDGTIGTIRKRGPHELLEREAVRILSQLPKMTPGKQRGTAVHVPFSIPITFKLQ